MSVNTDKSLSLGRMVLCLGVITIVAAALMAWVYTLTADPIARANEQARQEAIRAVTPDFDTLADPITGPEAVKVYPVIKEGHPVGAAVESFSNDGFSGTITVMYGFDTNGTVTGYQVLSHAETPGLGARMDQWFRMPEGRRSVIGRNPKAENMTVSKDGGDVDAITAATITSRAFLDALRRAHTAYQQTLGNE